jgi:hypothetical protein
MSVLSLVVPIHATPFGIVPIPEGPPLNARLEASFKAQAASQPGAATSGPLRFVGCDDLTESPDVHVRQLLAGMYRGLFAVIREVSAIEEAQLRSLSMQVRAWPTLIAPDGCVPPVNYPLSAWCAVYCVAAPPPSATRADSGLLRILETRFTTAFADATTAELRLPYRPGHYAWRPVPGQMAVFPAGLLHEIALLRAQEPLILVSLRARFVGQLQEGVGRW